MAAEIDGKEHTLKDVLGGEYAFHIPRYQRPYRWRVEQAGELLDDLLSASSGAAKIKQLDPYFLGSIVLVKAKNDPSSEVLDGQQRLTTLTVLLATLRKYVESTMGDDLTKYLYTKGNVVEDMDDHYRLRLRKGDQSFFEANIHAPGALGSLATANAETETQRNLKANAIELSTRLAALRVSDPEHLARLAKFMIQRCFLVVVSTQNFDSAYRIFSVLNDRGMDLSATDILKADLIGGIENEDLKDRYSKKWEQIEEEFGPVDFLNLFAHIRTAVSKTKVKVALLKHFREDILPTRKPMAFIDSILVPYARAFSELRDAQVDLGESDGAAAKISGLLVSLGHIDHGEWTPPALRAIEKYRATPNDLLRFLTRLESLASVLMILRTRRDQRVTRYLEVLEWFDGGESVDAPNASLDLSPGEKQGARDWLQGPIYGEKAARMTLLRLDGLLAGAGARYAYDVVTIEHVLPQTPAAGSQWLDDFKAAEQQELVNTLGNLVLLARRKNSHARNYEFAKKKKKYFGGTGGVSPFALTQQVLSHSTWTPKVILDRQRELVPLLVAAWQLD